MKDIKVLKTIQDVRNWRAQVGEVAFVPTMGALHQGHLDLVKKAGEYCPNIIVSIFVNPAQFAPNEDYDEYPRKTEQDIELLKGLNIVSAVYLPQKEEIYPRGIVLKVEEQVGTFVEVKGLSHQLEGAVRSHFFRGVATIVLKLFNIVEPTYALFGQKDAQQCVVLKNVVNDLCLKVKIVVCPIIRNENGLALSSRNQYLSEEEKITGLALFKGLSLGEKLYQDQVDPKELVQKVIDFIQSESRVQLDYIKLNDPNTLEEIVTQDQFKNGGLLSGAIRIAGVRLIDNICLGCEL